jgi:hypothetical protein
MLAHLLLLGSLCVGLQSPEPVRIYVTPAGSAQGLGTIEDPLPTLEAARDRVRAHPLRGKSPIQILLRDGVHRLQVPLELGPQDSGAAGAMVSYLAFEGEDVVVSGGMKLDLNWTDHGDGIFKATTPAGIEMDQLFVNGERQHMARYPNFDANVLPYNGYAADAFSPERAARWKDPAGGFIHAMHRAHWGGYHYRITGKKEDHTVLYEGGWQNNRQMGMHGEHRFVENVFEELDAPGEWLHDADRDTLYFYPPDGLDLAQATFEFPRMAQLLQFAGTPSDLVHHIEWKGICFRHTKRTFMETKEPLLRSDWTIFRGGCIDFTGAEDCAITNCELDQVGGNGIFVDGYNRRIAIRGCHIHGAGASGVCFVGSPKSVRNPLFEYHQQQHFDDIDDAEGPQTDDFPLDCQVDDCLIHSVSLVEKQATGVQISMSKKILVRHCSIYDVGRAGINISEGTFGGHTIEYCDVFDTVRETGDHGSFNSWGRDRFWHLKGAPPEKLLALSSLDTSGSTIRNSRWRCDRGWDVDLDDGSSHYEIYNNLFLNGGLKLREGFARHVYNNIAVNNSLHPHVWYPNSGDVITGNIWTTAYKPIRLGGWGKEIDRNIFLTVADRNAFRDKGCDANSIVCDPMFVDPASGDYRLKPGSPALAFGFKNFPMDQFGVQRAELKAIAKTPLLPDFAPPASQQARIDSPHYSWHGAYFRALLGQEYSAFGVSKDAGGVVCDSVTPGSHASQSGLQAGDVIQQVNETAIQTVKDFKLATAKLIAGGSTITLVRQQKTLKLTDF